MNIAPQIRDEYIRWAFMAYAALLPVDPDSDFYPIRDCICYI